MRLQPVIDCQCGRTILAERADIDPTANRDRAQYVKCPVCARVNSVTPYLWTSWLEHATFGEEAAKVASISESISASIAQAVVLPSDTVDPTPPASSPDVVDPEREAEHARKGLLARNAVLACATKGEAAKTLDISPITLNKWLTYAPDSSKPQA